jgi:hypothetical protein
MLAPLLIWFAPDMTRNELTDFVGGEGGVALRELATELDLGRGRQDAGGKLGAAVVSAFLGSKPGVCNASCLDKNRRVRR